MTKWIDSFDNNSFFVDIGANIGLYSLYAATKKINVIAFEPESLNFACLNLNIKDNNLEKYITAYPISIHDKNEVSVLNMRTMKFGGSGSSFDTTVDENQENFDPIFKQGSISFKLDEVLKKKNFIPNYIKIDVDGNELNVINSMPETLKSKYLKSVCIELNPDTTSGQEIINILKKDFPNYEIEKWYRNQKVFNYFFMK